MPVNFKNILNSHPVRPNVRINSALIKQFVEQSRVDGVFQGGGSLGTAYVGSLTAIWNNGIWFKRVAGNSAGAITAAMIAAGFTAPEIRWLSSAFPNAPDVPNSLSSVGINNPISFSSFLDLSNINTITQSNKRKTLLWKMLKGSLIDEIGRINIPTVTQSEAVNACVDGILNVPLLGTAIRGVNGTAILRNALNVALTPLPNNELEVKDFLPDTNALRTNLADTLWDAIGRNSPLLLLLTNLIHEGSLFEGNDFLRTISRLFGRKVHNNPEATVLFKDLKIPLALIAADVETGRMRVYNSKDHPEMVVAEAVRRSMSVPLAFQARGARGQIVDGGLFSNFPVWLFSAAGDDYWTADVIDNNRVKIGFSLDDKKAAKSSWNSAPARFTLEGDPPRVDFLEVVKTVLIEKMVETGVPRQLAEEEITWALVGDALDSGAGIELLKLASQVIINGFMNADASTRKIITDGLMNNLPYIDVSIPLLGYSGADFYINEEEAATLSIWDRGWHAAIDALVAAKDQTTLPASVRINSTETPFN